MNNESRNNIVPEPNITKNSLRKRKGIQDREQHTTRGHEAEQASSRKHRVEKNKEKSFNFDLIYSGDTSRRFLNRYVKNHDDLGNGNSVQLFHDTIKTVITKKTWVDDLSTFPFCDDVYKVGDKVRIMYIPDSQRYIDHYNEQSFSGQILFIDKDSDNIILFSESDASIDVRSLEREGCHYFGMSKGYTYFIERELH